MARVHTVTNNRKQYRCSKCRQDIPVGAGYRHASPGFRSARIIRCLRPECMFRTSDLTTSHMATAWAAIEAAEDDMATGDYDAATVEEDLQAVADTCAEGVQEAVDAYEEAMDAWPNGNEQIQERLDIVEGFHSELDGINFPSMDEFDNADDYIDGCRQALQDVLDGFEG